MLPQSSSSRSNLRIAAAFILSAAFAELLFRVFFWLTPNETAWESAPLFNFESAIVHTPAKRPDRTRVIIAGSSLATYGYLPELLEKRGFEAVTIAHQGMHGVELAAHWRRYAALDPDVVVIPVNMVDLRIERPVLLGLDLEGSGRSDSLQRLCEDLASMYGVLDLGGTGLWREFSQCLTLKQKSQIAGGLSAAYRLRSLARPGWSAAWDSRVTRGKSYEHYAGVPVIDAWGRAAVTHRGHVPGRFFLRNTEELRSRGLDLEILAEAARVEVSGAGGEADMQLTRGWRRLDLSGRASGELIEIRISKGVYFETFADTYAARLSQNAGGRSVRRSVNGTAFRDRRREDDLYEHMNDADYSHSFELRNLAFDRPGYAYLRALHEAKKHWAQKSFDPDLPAVQGLSRFVTNLRATGVRVILVNAPENPLTLRMYSEGPYYRGLLDYLERLGGADFMEESGSLPAQMFYDFHHLTFGGAEKNTERLARFLVQAQP
jgi:hypothetical protein